MVEKGEGERKKGRHELLDPDFVMAVSLQRSPGPLGDLHLFVKVVAPRLVSIWKKRRFASCHNRRRWPTPVPCF